MRNLIVFREPDFQPLPTTISEEDVRGAILPAKIEAASRAIAACTDLPELLQYRDQAEGLAAAVKVMRHVAPQMVRDANNLVADAWRKGGELLKQYSAARRFSSGTGGCVPSIRNQKARELGLSTAHANAMVRIANAPLSKVRELVQKSSSLKRVSLLVPATQEWNRQARSEAYKNIMGDFLHKGLNRAFVAVKMIDLSYCRLLDETEKTLIRKKNAEIMEILDAIDQNMK